VLETYICVRDVMCCRVERGDQAVSSGMLHHVVVVKKLSVFVNGRVRGNVMS
jgi:hypothetical protein